jgi:hypothetical protein
VKEDWRRAHNQKLQGDLFEKEEMSGSSWAKGEMRNTYKI